MNRIPWAERLNLLDEGVDKQEQNIAIIRQMADMPISTYLAALEAARNRLMEIVQMTPPQACFQSTNDIAHRVETICLAWDDKNEVVRILALPLPRLCSERINKHVQNTI